MHSKRACIYLLTMMGCAYSQTPRRTVPAPKPPDVTASNLISIEPVILTRGSLDEKVVTLRLAPRIATSIRLPEPVNSVIVGDPENFQAEHSDHEPELVTVKPVNTAPAQTNLLISTTLGHQLNLLLLSVGENAAGQQAVDVLLKYSKPQTASFLVEESSFSPSFIAETQRIGTELKRSGGSSLSATTTPLTELVKASAPSNPSPDTTNKGLDDLLARQKQAPLPHLYGQRPGEIEAGPRVRAGVSEVLDQGKLVVVLFSVMNPADHAIEILPPQIQLGGKLKKKWTTAEQLYVVDFRLSTRRLGAGQRADGVVVFERPSFKQSSETLFLQIADSGAVDLPALAPIGFGISTFRGGSAYESR
jgi:hypothetical protein